MAGEVVVEKRADHQHQDVEGQHQADRALDATQPATHTPRVYLRVRWNGPVSGSRSRAVCPRFGQRSRTRPRRPLALRPSCQRVSAVDLLPEAGPGLAFMGGVARELMMNSTGSMANPQGGPAERGTEAAG